MAKRSTRLFEGEDIGAITVPIFQSITGIWIPIHVLKNFQQNRVGIVGKVGSEMSSDVTEAEDSNDVDADKPVSTRLSSWFSGEDDNRWRFATCSSSGWAA
jgi:hypothetical protein